MAATTGPNGARTVLRDRRVERAVLEVARGCVAGLAAAARAARVINVANDHLGEFGIHDPSRWRTPLVAKAIGPDGKLALNADDPLLVRCAAGVPITWFSLDPANPTVARHLERGARRARRCRRCSRAGASASPLRAPKCRSRRRRRASQQRGQRPPRRVAAVGVRRIVRGLPASRAARNSIPAAAMSGCWAARP